MSKPSIFIASSSEKGLEITREIRRQLDDVAAAIAVNAAGTIR